MKKIFIAVMFFAFLGGAHVYATDPTKYAEIELKIKAFIPIPTGTFVYFDKPHICNQNGGQKFRAFLSKDHPNYSVLNGSLLAAQLAEQSVSVDFRFGEHYSCPVPGEKATIQNICVGDSDSTCFTSW